MVFVGAKIQLFAQTTKFYVNNSLQTDIKSQ